MAPIRILLCLWCLMAAGEALSAETEDAPEPALQGVSLFPPALYDEDRTQAPYVTPPLLDHHDADDSYTRSVKGRPEPVIEPPRVSNPTEKPEEEETFTNKVVKAAFLSPFTVPRILMADNRESAGYFLDYPYDEGLPGWLDIRPPGCPDHCKLWTVRGSVDYGNDLDDTQWLRGQLLADTTLRLGIDASWTSFDGYHRPGHCSCLDIGDFNFVYRFAQSPKLVLRAGGGINWQVDQRDSDVGLNLTYGGDWFPVKPLVFSFEADVGILTRVRASLGAVYKHGEMYLGYDYYRVDSVNLDGPMAGVRLWF